MSNGTLDPLQTARSFCESYYSLMTTGGFIDVISYFFADTICIFQGQIYNTPADMLKMYLNDGIVRILYDNIFLETSVIDNNTLLIYVTGLCRGVSYGNYLFNRYRFTEIFVLKYINGRLYVSNYIFDFY